MYLFWKPQGTHSERYSIMHKFTIQQKIENYKCEQLCKCPCKITPAI